MSPPPDDIADDDIAAVESLYGFMAGSVLIPDGSDLTAPVLQQG